MARITVAKLFETVAEVDQRSQVALMQSEDSIKISEKNRINLERLVATLRTDFTDIEQTEEIIRADKEEDNTIRSSFFELQKSFDGLVGTVDILRTDLDNLYESFYTSQIKRQDLLNQEEAKVFKEEDDLQKGRGLEKEGKGALSNMFGNKKDPNQVAQERKKEEKSLVKSILSTLGLGALAGGAMGLGDAFGSDDQGGGPVQTGSVNAAEIDADTPLSQALIATVRELEGTADPTGYSTFFGDKPGEPKYGDIREKNLLEVDDLQTLFLKDPQSEFTDLTGKTDRSAAVGIGQFINPLEQARQMYEARGEKFDPTKIKFSEELQNQLILDLAARKRGIDLSKELTKDEFDILQDEWSSFGPNNNQTTRNLNETLRVYQENVKEARESIKPNSNKQANQDNFDSAGNKINIGDVVGGDDMQPSPSTGGQDKSKTKVTVDFGFGEIDLLKPLGAEGDTTQVDPETGKLSIVPQSKSSKSKEQQFRQQTAEREARAENQVGAKVTDPKILKMIAEENEIGRTGKLPSDIVSISEDRKIADLQPNRSPNTSFIDLPGEVIDGGTPVDPGPRGNAASQSTPLSNTRNGAPVAMMIETKYLV